MRNIDKITIAIILVFSAIGFAYNNKENTTEVERAFYYWKSGRSEISETEFDYLKDLKVHKIYLKFFEVEPDSVFGSKPYSKTRIYNLNRNYFSESEDTALYKHISKLQIVPTIYLQNKVFYDTSKESLDNLADNIVFLINKMYLENIDTFTNYKEIQLDCDWTKSTKDNYFYLISKVKSLSQKEISCTLRLYPYKYSDLLGVPPVDRATLMCYNLISPVNNDDKNSILDNNELKSYLNSSKRYPVHLDIALPVYSLVYNYNRKNNFLGVNKLQDSTILQNVRTIKPLWYQMADDVNVYTYNEEYGGEHTYKAGSFIKVELIDEKLLNGAIELLKENIDFDKQTTITLFSLDERDLKMLKNETLDNCFTAFTK